MPASMPRRRMKASIALLRPVALLLIVVRLLRDHLRENLVVDQIEVSAHPAQVPQSGARRSFESPVVIGNDVGPDPDLTVRMGEFDRSPRRLELSRGSGGHACKCG